MAMTWPPIVSAQAGVVSRLQLRAAGFSDGAVSRMIARGELNSVASAVFLIDGAPFELTARCWAAHLSTAGVIGFATAAQLWGMAAIAPNRVHVCVDEPRRSRSPDWIRLHRVPVLAGAVDHLNGLPLTSRAWTALDMIATTKPASAASSTFDRAIQQGWLTGPEIEDRLRRFPGRAGNRRLRTLLGQLGDGAAADSERLLHGLLRSAGLRDWRPNYRLTRGGELIAVVDVAFPHAMVAIEVDGFAFHSDVERFRRDRTRQNRLVELGWTVLRFTWADLTERPGYVVATVTRILAIAC